MSRNTMHDPAGRRILAGLARDIRRGWLCPYVATASAAAELRQCGFRYSVISETCGDIARKAVASVRARELRNLRSLGVL